MRLTAGLLSRVLCALVIPHLVHLGGMSKRAKAGQGMDGAKISGMLAMLNYQADKGKDAKKAENAKKALEVYRMSKTAEQKAQFLQQFEANGSGKGSDSLKFAWTFVQTIESQKVQQHGVKEGLFTRLTCCSILCIYPHIVRHLCDCTSPHKLEVLPITMLALNGCTGVCV